MCFLQVVEGENEWKNEISGFPLFLFVSCRAIPGL